MQLSFLEQENFENRYLPILTAVENKKGVLDVDTVKGAALMPFAIACAEVASVVWVVQIGWSAIPWVGTGGALGIITAMRLHAKYR